MTITETRTPWIANLGDVPATLDYFQGSMYEAVEKIAEIRAMLDRTGCDAIIEVDGGVKQSNAARVIDAGADVLVMGTGLFRAEDPKAVVQSVMGA